MKKLLANFTNNKLITRLCLSALCALAFAQGVKAQESVQKSKHEISASADISSMEHSFKNNANSILTWRDLSMAGATIDISNGKRGIRAKFAKSIGYGYSTDDDIDNDIKQLSQHYAKALQAGVAVYKKLSDGNQSIGIGADYTFLNNCKAGIGGMISAHDYEMMRALLQNIEQGIVSRPADNAQKYHLFQIRPYYECHKHLLAKGNSSFECYFIISPILYVGYGDWTMEKRFYHCGLELGGKVSGKWMYKKRFFAEIFNESSFGGPGFAFSKHGVGGLKNTKTNAFGISVGMVFNGR
jgi:hypothetical protein